MLDFIKRNRRVFIISLTAFCLALMIITSVNKTNPTFFGNALSYVTAPLQRGVSAVGAWVQDKVDFFTGMSKLHDENQRLKDENALLTIELSRLRSVDAENEEYAKLLATNRKYADYPVTVARVIGADPGNWYKRFTIDQGSNDGIIKNMVVLADGALVGFVSQVWPRSARVNAIINDTSGVSAKVYRTGDTGIVSGNAKLMMEGLCMMEFNNPLVDVREGDEICTSQHSSIYPPDIVIGHVTEVYVDAKGMKAAIIQPAADFTLVDYVLVITELFDIEAGD